MPPSSLFYSSAASVSLTVIIILTRSTNELERTRVCFKFTRCGHRPPKVDTPHRTVTAHLKWTRRTHLAFSGSCRLSVFFFSTSNPNLFHRKVNLRSKGRTATAHLMWTRCTHWSCQHFFFHEVRPLLTRSSWTAPYSHHPPEVNALYLHALFPGHVPLFLQSFFFFLQTNLRLLKIH